MPEGMITCEGCPGNSISSEGATFCTDCADGTIANNDNTQCGKPICLQSSENERAATHNNVIIQIGGGAAGDANPKKRKNKPKNQVNLPILV